MRKHLMFFVGVLLFISQAKGQFTTFSAPAIYPVLITIKDSTIISFISSGKPIFTVSGMNTIVNAYNVTGFQKAYPTSRFRAMRTIYRMNVSDTVLPKTLVSSYGSDFLGWQLIPQKTVMPFYSPSDFYNIAGQRNVTYLDSIHARQAWDVTKGDTSIVVAVFDNEFDTTHLDLKNKIARTETASALWFLGNTGHGTRVAGLIGAETDTNNTIGYPSIGFKTKLDLIGCVGLYGDLYDRCPTFLTASQYPRHRRVINLSQGVEGLDTLFFPDNFMYLSEEMQNQEIYENGTLFVAAAGNGLSQLHTGWGYTFPASMDYIFAVSGIGWKNARNMGYTFNVSGLHEKIPGDSTSSFQHNSRVDLLAPAVEVGGLQWYNSRDDGTGYNGTSLSAPLVAGTAALIYSLDSCYTPYQLEYILKKSADSKVLTYPTNLKYAGKLGAGALDAERAVKMADPNLSHSYPGVARTNCNDPATTTMYIEGIELNTRCVPGRSSNGVKPILTPVIRNGTPPYTCRWEPLPKLGNMAFLNNYNATTVQIDSATEFQAPVYGSIFIYRITVYDASTVQKVASRIIEIELKSDPVFDLASRDSYMDMLNEPNTMTLLDHRETQYYMSPDLWNRQAINDHLHEHQNAEYFNNPLVQNYAHINVRNVGCSPYTTSSNNRLHLYYTVASTGENWSGDFNGSGTVGGASTAQPSGGEITNASGILIPNLQPGEDTVIVQGWRPPKPQDFAGTPTDLNVCLLSRITPISGSEPSGPIIGTVRPYNNIVTRNLWVKNVNTQNKINKTRVYVANASGDANHFDLQFINDKEINLHFAGNFSALGTVKLYLGDLYAIWNSAGFGGHYLSKDDVNKTVTFDGSTTLDLLNLELPAGAKYAVDVEFIIASAITTLPDYEYTFHLRQFVNDQGHRSDDIYGSMTFQINTGSVQDGMDGFKTANEIITDAKSKFNIHPNPVSDNLAITYLGDEEKTVDLSVFDITGRKMLVKTNQHFQNSFVELNVSEFVPGVYFINIVNSKGLNERFKFIKQ